MVAEMMDSLAGQIGGAVVTEIFPVTVVSMTGDQVVLSQGGESLQAGQHWQAVLLGEELKDPQTGRSLGRHEVPLGTVRVDRVSTQTSYGTLLEGADAVAGKPFQPGGIVLKSKMTAKVMSSKPADSQARAPSTQPVSAQPARHNARLQQNQESAATPAPAPDESKW
jgi:hypothetical protein